MLADEYFTISGGNKISQKYGRIRQKRRVIEISLPRAKRNTANLLISISTDGCWRKCSGTGRKMRFRTPATVTQQPRQEAAGARASPAVLRPARPSISALNAHVSPSWRAPAGRDTPCESLAFGSDEPNPTGCRRVLIANAHARF